MRKAFTLIEVMIVLSILAIIAILGYNFFGSTMKEAVQTQRMTQVHNGIVTLANAYEEYYRKNGEWGFTQDTGAPLLVDAGILKASPTLPSPWKTVPEGWNVFPNGSTVYYQARNGHIIDYGNTGGTALPDVYIGVRIEDSSAYANTYACLDYNDRYTNLGKTKQNDTCAGNITCCMTLTKYGDPYIVYTLEER